MAIILAAKDVETDLPPSRYNGWDKFVRRPLFLATGVDIAELFDRNKDADPKIEGQIILLETWFEQYGDTPCTSRSIRNKISPGLSGNNSGMSDAVKDLFDGQIPTSSTFGKYLSGIKDRVIGGYKITSKKSTTGENKNISLWRVEQVSEEEST